MLRCDLLSSDSYRNCIFEILKTTRHCHRCWHLRLWFAFILYLWNIENNKRKFSKAGLMVVICFHLVSLKYWKQLSLVKTSLPIGCDLLSSCIFEILKTTIARRSGRAHCCDLLSSCIFEILKTTAEVNLPTIAVLWFAFILYLWNIENNAAWWFKSSRSVVICFHLVSLKYWKQQDLFQSRHWEGCDLLSSCIFEIFKTTLGLSETCHNGLWFAFILYLWNIENNYKLFFVHYLELWFAFILYLWNIENNAK